MYIDRYWKILMSILEILDILISVESSIGTNDVVYQCICDIGNTNPNWLIFSEGLKPPTSICDIWRGKLGYNGGISGWCFGTFGLFFRYYWECHHPNWQTHIFQRGRYTTNQYMWYMTYMMCIYILYSNYIYMILCIQIILCACIIKH